MRRALVVLLAAMLPSPGQSADVAASAPEMKEILHSVIRQQLEAFRRNDYAAAYEFAAEGIRKQFPVDAFERMVRTGYPLIAQSTDVRFGLTLDNGDRAVVTVRVIAGEKSTSYHYLLERSGSEWRIAGVQKLDEKATVI